MKLTQKSESVRSVLGVALLGVQNSGLIPGGRSFIRANSCPVGASVVALGSLFLLKAGILWASEGFGRGRGHRGAINSIEFFEVLFLAFDQVGVEGAVF